MWETLESNRNVKYYNFKNKYSLKKDGKTFILVLLSFKQVYEDQLKLKAEKNSKKKINQVRNKKIVKIKCEHIKDD